MLGNNYWFQPLGSLIKVWGWGSYMPCWQDATTPPLTIKTSAKPAPSILESPDILAGIAIAAAVGVFVGWKFILPKARRKS